MKAHEYINSNPAAFDSNCEACGGKLRDSIHLDRCRVYWNAMGWQAKERFLLSRGFAGGWSSHTWQKLDRPIQVAFEIYHGVLKSDPA